MTSDDFFDGLEESKAMLRPSAKKATSDDSGWRVLYDISTLFNMPNRTFDEILESIVEAAMKLTSADRGLLMLFNDQSRLEVKLAKNMSYRGLPEEERKVSQSVVDEVLRKEEGVFIANVEEVESIAQLPSIASLKILSVMCVPLKVTFRGEESGRQINSGRKILGVLYVDARSVSKDFHAQRLELLQALANYATTAIINSQMYRKATTDSATGLLTRSHFEQRLSDEVKLAHRHRTQLALMMIDVDNMREINKEFGYKEGDRILAAVAEVIRDRARRIDMAARYGGNKFTIVMPLTGQAEAIERASRLLKAIAGTNFFPDKMVASRITSSIGLSVLRPGRDAAELVRQADKALYAAKRSGSNEYRLYSGEMADVIRGTDRLAGVFSGDPARDYRNVLMLLETIEDINKRTQLDELLPRVVDVVIDLSTADRGLLILTTEEGGLSVRVARGRDKKIVDDLDFSKSVVQRAIDKDQPVRQTFSKDDVTTSQSIGRLDIQAVMCVPLTIHGSQEQGPKTIGALYVDRRSYASEFDEASLAFFDTLARQIAVAIENARLYQRNDLLRQKLAMQLDQTKQELNTVKIELADRTREIEHKYNYDKIIGRSDKMVQLFRLLDRITDSNVAVFIHGESGSGKELVANAIHYNGRRRKKRLISENCAALNDSLLESELFGYVKGAFTGADTDRAGLFEAANDSTLFLDEVGDMSMSMQKKLLRVLEESEVRRVGGKAKIKVNVRIISASHQDLQSLVQQGKFRDDLYYRLNVVKVELPPLRERKEDIPLLADHFLNMDDGTGRKKSFSKEAIQRMLVYHWPGNVRELKNVVDRAKIICDDEIVEVQHIILDAKIGDISGVVPLEPRPAPAVAPKPKPPVVPVSTASTSSDPLYESLNERQRKLVEYLRTYETIKNREYYEYMNVSKSTGWRDLKDLMARKVILAQGKGKGSIYTLSEAYKKR